MSCKDGNTNCVSFAVETEEEILSSTTESKLPGRITFTERGIYLGFGAGFKALYDGKSLNNALRFKGIVQEQPSDAIRYEVFYYEPDQSLLIKNDGEGFTTIPLGLKEDEIQNIINNSIKDLGVLIKLRGSKANQSEIDSIENPEVGDAWYNVETKVLMVYSTSNGWFSLGSLVNLDGYASKDEINTLIENKVNELLGNYVSLEKYNKELPCINKSDSFTISLLQGYVSDYPRIQDIIDKYSNTNYNTVVTVGFQYGNPLFNEDTENRIITGISVFDPNDSDIQSFRCIPCDIYVVKHKSENKLISFAIIQNEYIGSIDNENTLFSFSYKVNNIIQNLGES